MLPRLLARSLPGLPRRVPSLPSSPATEVYNPKTVFPHAASLGQAFAHCPIFPTAASRRSLDRISVPMWPVNLSVRLPVFGLVGLYPTNYLIGRETLHQRIAPFHPWAYGVLIPVSRGYPPLMDRSSRFTHPSATQYMHRPAEAFKFIPSSHLHVLSTPPAFVLSQDQTLHKIHLASLFCFPIFGCQCSRALCYSCLTRRPAQRRRRNNTPRDLSRQLPNIIFIC